MTGEVRPQEGSIGNSKDLAHGCQIMFQGAGRSARAGIKGSNRQNSGPPLLPKLRTASLYLCSILDLQTKFPFTERKDCAVMQMKGRGLAVPWMFDALDLAPLLLSPRLRFRLSVETTSRRRLVKGPHHHWRPGWLVKHDLTWLLSS